MRLEAAARSAAIKEAAKVASRKFEHCALLGELEACVAGAVDGLVVLFPGRKFKTQVKEVASKMTKVSTPKAPAALAVLAASPSAAAPAVTAATTPAAATPAAAAAAAANAPTAAAALACCYRCSLGSR